MDVNPGIGKGRVARHVVLVGVAVDDRVNRQPDPAGCGDGDRRVDDHRFGGASDQQRVARWVGAVRLAGEQGDGFSELLGVVHDLQIRISGLASAE